jgi:peptidyl-tRNA hydrolase, PTH2 family
VTKLVCDCLACELDGLPPFIGGDPRTAKQVIVMRKDLNMRKGKMIAQGAHASLGAVWIIEDYIKTRAMPGRMTFDDLHAYYQWHNGLFTKVCVSVNSAEELHEIASRAEDRDIPNKLIIDSGATEFHGVPTLTCLAIGPTWAENVDPITGHLPLL